MKLLIYDKQELNWHYYEPPLTKKEIDSPLTTLDKTKKRSKRLKTIKPRVRVSHNDLDCG